MIAPTAPRPAAGRPLVAIVGYTLRTSLPGRRWVGILVPCAAAVVFGALSGRVGGDVEANFADMAGLALFGLVMPVTCLVVGDAVLGAEVRSGSFAFTWLSPVPTWQIAVGRWLGGTFVAASCLAVAFAASAVVAGAGRDAGPVALAAVVGAMAYVAVFVAIGCMAKRAAAWSLAFVFLFERLLGAALAGIAQLSPSWLARATYVELADAPQRLVRDGVPHGTAGIVRLLIITVVMLAISARQLHRMHLSGSSD